MMFGPWNIQVPSKCSDQTARMRKLIWGFAGRIYHIVRNLMKQLTYLFYSVVINAVPQPNLLKISNAYSI